MVGRSICVSYVTLVLYFEEWRTLTLLFQATRNVKLYCFTPERHYRNNVSRTSVQYSLYLPPNIHVTRSSLFPGPYTSGVVVASAPPSNTTWYNTQTTFRAPPTKTATVNATTATLVAARTSYCPLSSDDIAGGLNIYDLPDACADLLLPYCFPDPDAPVLPSTKFPVVCTPTKATASSTSTSAPTNAKPAPIEPSTIASCKQYYKVLDGDNCYSIANNFKVTLTQVCFLCFKARWHSWLIGSIVQYVESIRWVGLL